LHNRCTISKEFDFSDQVQGIFQIETMVQERITDTQEHIAWNSLCDQIRQIHYIGHVEDLHIGYDTVFQEAYHCQNQDNFNVIWYAYCLKLRDLDCPNTEMFWDIPRHDAGLDYLGMIVETYIDIFPELRDVVMQTLENFNDHYGYWENVQEALTIGN